MEVVDSFVGNLNPTEPISNERKGIMAEPNFADDIRPLFRSSDIESMKPAGIDLSSYEDVKKKAQSIYARLLAKDMPCDGPWSDQSVQKFKEWMQSGMKP